MTATLVDSNVILDIMTEDPAWFDWSSAAFERCANEGTLCINPIIYAEVSIRFTSIEELASALPDESFRYLSLPLEAAFLAGKVFQQYRRQKGVRTSTLPYFSSVPMPQ